MTVTLQTVGIAIKILNATNPGLSVMLLASACHAKPPQTANKPLVGEILAQTEKPCLIQANEAVDDPIAEQELAAEETNSEEASVPEEAAFQEGAAICIAKSKELNAEDITMEEIREMMEEVLYASDEFGDLIQNGHTVVIKPNLVQMRVDSTGELLEQTVNGITADWR
ncbi:MAG: hypothetical protein LBU32_02480 [Clostridiales bacterium]|jgi:hypothetical protein|nr:hypothetical protein [Clostridiales bacterium]